MIDFLLCTSVSEETGELVAKTIAKLQGVHCHLLRDGDRKPGQGRYVRYGSHQIVPTPLFHLNKLAAVKLASHKLFALFKIRDFAPVPYIFVGFGTMLMSSFTRIYRRRKRYAGKDDPYILPAGQEPDIDRVVDYDYALEFIQSCGEFRVHICRGKAIRTQKKVAKEGVVPNPDIRTHENGWRYEDVEIEAEYQHLQQIGIKAVQSLGLDFGAVDIVQNQMNGQLLVLEVNTAPALNKAGRECYARAFIEWDQQTPAEGG